MKICPYCGGKNNIKNTNLTHKYYHDTKGCRNYTKKCVFCGKKYAEKNNEEIKDLTIVENIFEKEFCDCGAWLPDFPTSWTRSFTNLSKINEVIKDVYNNRQKEISSESLFKIQRTHSGVVVNLTRAEIRGLEEYLSGASKRRMSEYINSLRNMSTLNIKGKGKYGRLFHDITKFGEELATTDNLIELLANFIIAFINIKINNGMQTNYSNSCYQFFKIRFTYNILYIINKLNEDNQEVTKYHIALSLLARDHEQLKKQSHEIAKKFSAENLKSIFFENEDELNRAVVCTFLNVFESLILIEKNSNNYTLTDLGLKVLKFLETRPAIWYKDLKEVSSLNNEVNDVFAKLLIWRLLKHDLIDKEYIKTDMEEIENLIKDINEIYAVEIKDIHINLFYDEPHRKKHENNTEEILEYMEKYLEGFYEPEIIEMCMTLPGIWFDEILNLIETSIPNIEEEETLENLLEGNKPTGQDWHDRSQEYFRKIGFEPIDYKDNRVFEKVTIPKLKLYLPGTTIYNPDYIIPAVGYGPENCILVDSKDENSITGEVHKLIGYNKYANNENVNSYVLIPIRGILPETTKNNIKGDAEDFDRITIIDEKALKYLANLEINTDKILDFILPCEGFKHINLQKVKDHFNY